MRRHVESLRAVNRATGNSESPLALVTTPVLRYSDPGGITTDASVWIWGTPGRPAIVAGIFFLSQEGRDPKWSCELLALADGGASVHSPAGWSWTPQKNDLEWIRIDGRPGDSERQRLRQMKEIAEQFEVTTFESKSQSQLRLMVQPLYRFADEQRGLIDGAIFSFASGTNPEALLLVECRRDGESLAWYAAFARFGASRCQARRGDMVLWDRPAIRQWNAQEPYFSQFGPVERVFEAAAAR